MHYFQQVDRGLQMAAPMGELIGNGGVKPKNFTFEC